MPIYEYQCHDCQERAEFFFRRFTDLEGKTMVCPTCQGPNLERLISSVAVVSPARPDRPQPTAQPAVDQANSSQALAQTMQRASRQAGQDMGQEFKEVAGRLARGESARSVETALRQRVGEKMEPH